MKIQSFEDEKEWLAARLGKITGSRLKDVIVKRGTEKKKGFYELIAERIGTIRPPEKPMDRGHRLEDEALDRFAEATEKQVDRSLVIWMRDEDENIAVSPDGIVSEEEAVEVKCLSSASHIEAYLTQQTPKEYKEQFLQYFIVNDKLKTLHVCFYDPSLTVADFFFITISRADVLAEIESTLIYERETLQEVESIVKKLLSF